MHEGVIMRASTLGENGRVANAACGVLLSLLVSGCAGGAPANPESSTAPTGESEFVSRRPNEISREEIVAQGTNAHHAMGLIQRLRPAWLRSRGSNSFTAPAAMYPVVYVDEMRREGGLRALLQIPTSEIRRLEFMGPSDATIRWGTGHQAGVIWIVTGR